MAIYQQLSFFCSLLVEWLLYDTSYMLLGKFCQFCGLFVRFCCVHETDASQMLSSWLTGSEMPLHPLLKTGPWVKTFIWGRLL